MRLSLNCIVYALADIGVPRAERVRDLWPEDSQNQHGITWEDFISRLETKTELVCSEIKALDATEIMKGWPRLARVFVPKLFPEIDASALFSAKSCPEVEVRKISGRRQWTMVRAGDSDKVDTVSVSKYVASTALATLMHFTFKCPPEG